MTDKAISGTDSRKYDRLLPCPFCGGESNGQTTVNVTETARSGPRFGVHCYFCGARVEFFETIDEAIAAWNTRTTHGMLTDEQVREAIEEASGALPMTEEAMAEHGWVRERTCHNASYRLDESRFHCSACEFGCWVKDVGDGRDKLPNYCPNCGARVER